jgi:hypothetical protein
MMIASVVLEMFLAILWFCAPPEKARFLEVLLPYLADPSNQLGLWDGVLATRRWG